MQKSLFRQIISQLFTVNHAKDRNKHTTHYDEIYKNLASWDKKPLLRTIYRNFYKDIAAYLRNDLKGYTIEVGSGIGKIKEIITQCICTDIYKNPWIDQVEQVYRLSFDDNEVSNIIMIDVFHHLHYPGSALSESFRVLCRDGRLIIFEPHISLLGWIVYGLCHHEPVAMGMDIEWTAPKDFNSDDDSYYAAQGNATRIFWKGQYVEYLDGWNKLICRRMPCISYIASGGYSKHQLYPTNLLPLMRVIDSCCEMLPWLFATRILVVLEKR